jgi:hypothetical protein
MRSSGSRSKLTQHRRREALKRIEAGDETDKEIARSYNVSRWTNHAARFSRTGIALSGCGNSGASHSSDAQLLAEFENRDIVSPRRDTFSPLHATLWPLYVF